MRVLYYPRNFIPEDGVRPVEGLYQAVQQVGSKLGVDITSPLVHRLAILPEINVMPDSFWVQLANQHQVEGYITYADFLFKTFGIREDPSLGAEGLKKSINSILARFSTPPIIVILFTKPIRQVKEEFPEFVNALQGRTHLVECGCDTAPRCLAFKIVDFFTRPRPY